MVQPGVVVSIVTPTYDVVIAQSHDVLRAQHVKLLTRMKVNLSARLPGWPGWAGRSVGCHTCSPDKHYSSESEVR